MSAETTAPVAQAVPKPQRTPAARRGRRERTVGLVSVSAVVVTWWFAAHFQLVNTLLLPGPGEIVAGAVGLTLSGLLPSYIAVSMGRVLIGFCIAFAVALPLGTLIGMSSAVRAAVNPLVELVRPIPPIAMIPLAMLWLGIDEASKYSIIAYGAFFPIVLSTVAGYAAVDPIHIRAARTLGASRWQIFRYVILMSAFPNIIVGARLGMGMAFIVLVASELIAASSGLGFLIMDARSQFRTDWLFVGMITMGLLGFLLNHGLMAIQRRVLRWQIGSEQELRV